MLYSENKKEVLHLDNFRLPPYAVQLSYEEGNIIQYQIEDIKLFYNYRYEIAEKIFSIGKNSELYYMDAIDIKQFIDENTKLFYCTHRYIDPINENDYGSLLNPENYFAGLYNNSEVISICERFNNIISNTKIDTTFIYNIDLLYKIYKIVGENEFSKFIEERGLSVDVIADIKNKKFTSYKELLSYYGFGEIELPSNKFNGVIKNIRCDNNQIVIDIMHYVFNK
jgi:hypothetical protein